MDEELHTAIPPLQTKPWAGIRPDQTPEDTDKLRQSLSARDYQGSILIHSASRVGTLKLHLCLGGGLLCAVAALGNVSAIAQHESVMVDSSAIHVVPRAQNIKLYPCTTCHDRIPTNSKRRTVSAHPQTFDHGAGRIWCLDCHQAEHRDQLTAHGSGPYTFDEASEVCAICHPGRYRDWQGGAHGKRVGNWQGERLVYSCVHCHNPHDPSIKPRAPSPPPSVRRGLEPAQSRPDDWQPSWRDRDDQGGQP